MQMKQAQQGNSIPGLKVVIPWSPKEAKGVLLSSIRDPNPVIFFEPKALYCVSVEDVPENDYMLPLSVAEVLRKGSDITFIGWGAQLSAMEEACTQAAKQSKATVMASWSWIHERSVNSIWVSGLKRMAWIALLDFVFSIFGRRRR